jgi:hypothetical protein
MTAGSEDLVMVEQKECVGGCYIGIAQLNAPKTLNGLSLEMTRLRSSSSKERVIRLSVQEAIFILCITA